MLTIEIRVNGSLVVALTATNRGPHGVFSGDEPTYEYQAVSFPIDNKGPCVTKHGHITHKRCDGIEALAEKLCHAASTAVGKEAGK
jgi:hypothetical protein